MLIVKTSRTVITTHISIRIRSIKSSPAFGTSLHPVANIFPLSSIIQEPTCLDKHAERNDAE